MPLPWIVPLERSSIEDKQCPTRVAWLRPDKKTFYPLKYWLRWHYHVKDIAGAPYKIKKKRNTNKTTESPTDNSYVQYNHDRLVIVKRRPVFSSRRNVVSDGAFLTDDARAEAAGHRVLDGTTSMAESAERRRRRVSTSDVRCRLSARYAGAVPWRQPECDSLRNSQPMEFTKLSPRWVNETGGGIQYGLAAGRGYQREPSCSSARTKVSKACRDRDRCTLRIWRRAAKHALTETGWSWRDSAAVDWIDTDRHFLAEVVRVVMMNHQLKQVSGVQNE